MLQLLLEEGGSEDGREQSRLHWLQGSTAELQVAGWELLSGEAGSPRPGAGQLLGGRGMEVCSLLVRGQGVLETARRLQTEQLLLQAALAKRARRTADKLLAISGNAACRRC